MERAARPLRARDCGEPRLAQVRPASLPRQTAHLLVWISFPGASSETQIRKVFLLVQTKENAPSDGGHSLQNATCTGARTWLFPTRENAEPRPRTLRACSSRGSGPRGRDRSPSPGTAISAPRPSPLPSHAAPRSSGAAPGLPPWSCPLNHVTCALSNFPSSSASSCCFRAGTPSATASQISTLEPCRMQVWPVTPLDDSKVESPPRGTRSPICLSVWAHGTLLPVLPISHEGIPPTTPVPPRLPLRLLLPGTPTSPAPPGEVRQASSKALSVPCPMLYGISTPLVGVASPRAPTVPCTDTAPARSHLSYVRPSAEPGVCSGHGSQVINIETLQ